MRLIRYELIRLAGFGTKTPRHGSTISAKKASYSAKQRGFPNAIRTLNPEDIAIFDYC